MISRKFVGKIDVARTSSPQSFSRSMSSAGKMPALHLRRNRSFDFSDKLSGEQKRLAFRLGLRAATSVAPIR